MNEYAVVGLGDINASLIVYIANTPDFQDLTALESVRPLQSGEIKAIGDACGNGWRKVFNVYAKFIYALSGSCRDERSSANFEWLKEISAKHQTWQEYRDSLLLQEKSNVQLQFSKPEFHQVNRDSLHIVMGRTYAKSLDIPDLLWLNEEFAISRSNNIIVCPYFDYRQLSNIKIIYLIEQVLNKVSISKSI